MFPPCDMRKADKTKQFIIAQSAELFNQKGFAGTSIQDILLATGLTKGGLYGNFESKEDLAIQAFDYAVQYVNDSVRQRTQHIRDAVDKLKSVVYFYREHVLDPPIKGGCPILNTATEADDAQPTLRAKVVAALDDWQAKIVHTIQKGQERQQVRPDVDAAAFAVLFIGILEGGILMTRAYKQHIPFDIISEHLLAQVEALRQH